MIKKASAQPKPAKWYRLMFNWTENKRVFGAFRADLPYAPGDQLHRMAREIEPITKWSRSAWVGNEPDCDGPPEDYLMNNEGLVILSARVQEAMHEAGIGVDDVQWLPIHVRRHTGEEFPGYAVMNVLTRIEALDRPACDCLREKDEIDPRIGKPRAYAYLYAQVFGIALEGHDVVRLLDIPSTVIMSERFAKLWKKHKFTGAHPEEVRVTPGPAPADFKKLRFQPAEIVD